MLFRLGLIVLTAACVMAAEDSDKFKKLKNPFPYSKKSISQGRGVFARYCVSCHGPDGKATVDVVADATDLTSPKQYRFGSSDGEIYHSIADGQGASMPAFKPQFTQQDDLWHLVNFIRSLWPESTRPPLSESEK